jgi:purine-binding chemotaxis protein CheW
MNVEAPMTAHRRQFSTFLVDGLYFGIEVLNVQEVIRYQKMTRVPLAPSVVRGLINLRGQIVTAIDLRERLGLSARRGDAQPMNVVVRTADGAVSLLVDDIADVVTVEEDALEQVPETLPPMARELTTAIYKLKDRLLLILDVNKTIDLAGLAG